MTHSIAMNEKEQLTAVVYGDTFALYDEQAFDEFIAPFYTRLKVNGIDTSIFQGKRCLDAGCGGGRGSILMAECGASEVVGVDLSPRNVESSRKRAEQKGLANLSFINHSLIELPFDDESFDIVWCNGVLHHTTNPDQCLKEITRVLKIDGHLWLYLYGSGGIYWRMVDWVRKTLSGIDVRECIYLLRMMDSPVRRIAEWIDDWFCAYLRRYTIADVTNRLNELGFDQTGVLHFGEQYDTSNRLINAATTEQVLMGEGDIRHWCRKSRQPSGNQCPLPDPPDGRGSPFQDGEDVTQFATPLSKITDELNNVERSLGHEISAHRVIVCRSIHRFVRTMLETNQPFDTDALNTHLASVASLLQSDAIHQIKDQ